MWMSLRKNRILDHERGARCMPALVMGRGDPGPGGGWDTAHRGISGCVRNRRLPVGDVPDQKQGMDVTGGEHVFGPFLCHVGGQASNETGRTRQPEIVGRRWRRPGFDRPRPYVTGCRVNGGSDHPYRFATGRPSLDIGAQGPDRKSAYRLAVDSHPSPLNGAQGRLQTGMSA
jgi:hypothetical protein